jgi:hypothetical protein
MNHPAVLAFAAITSCVVALVIFSALPPIRERHHKWVLLNIYDSRLLLIKPTFSVFEYHHRFAGWSGIGCVWIFVVLSVCQVKIDNGWTWSGYDLVHSQQFWYAVFSTVL